MAEITSGIRAILANPIVYEVFQTLIGSKKYRQNFMNNIVRPLPGTRILDIGCGPGYFAEFIPDGVDYCGFDLSAKYIARAKSKYGDRASFFCERVSKLSIKELPAFDVVLAIGVFHHLEDEEAVQLCEIAHQALAPNGRLIAAADPCFFPGQSLIDRFFTKLDRGQNVRTPEQYVALASRFFDNIESHVQSNQLLIPQSGHYMICRNT